MLDIHTHIPGNADSVLNVSYKDVSALPELFSFGLHPWDVREASVEEELKLLERAVEEHCPSFIGECGVDKVCGAELETQLYAFERQVLLAREKALPLIVHCVKSANEVATILRRANFENAVVIHGVRSGLKQMRPLVDLSREKEIYFSFGARFREETLRFFYPERFLTESDEGKIEETYEEIERVLGEDVEEAVRRNWARVMSRKI